MDGLSEPIRIILALVIGGLIGLEREINEKKSIDRSKKPVAIMGVRSFSLIGGLGSLAGILYDPITPFSLLLSGSFMILLFVFYTLDSLATRDFGLTTEIAILYTYLIGFILMHDIVSIQLLLAITVILILLLSRKDQIKGVVEGIKRAEVNAFIGYAIIALVILPFLPNQTYSLSDIPGSTNFVANFGFEIQKLARIELFNPFKIWLIVALITGVDMAGYALERTIGQKKGWILTSIAGGFISSTATTQSLAHESKETRHIHHLLASALLANLVSFFQIAIIIGTINSAFLIKLLPTLGSILLFSFGTVIFFMRAKEKGKEHAVATLKPHKIFDLGAALKFASLFLIISVISKIGLEFFGNTVFLATTVIGSIIGIDAVMINTSELAGKAIDVRLGVIAFTLANAVNLYAKTFYSFLQGRKDFAIKFGVSVTGIILFSLLGLLFV